jgi:hypothetical protein
LNEGNRVALNREKESFVKHWYFTDESLKRLNRGTSDALLKYLTGGTPCQAKKKNLAQI